MELSAVVGSDEKDAKNTRCVLRLGTVQHYLWSSLSATDKIKGLPPRHRRHLPSFINRCLVVQMAVAIYVNECHVAIASPLTPAYLPCVRKAKEGCLSPGKGTRCMAQELLITPRAAGA